MADVKDLTQTPVFVNLVINEDWTVDKFPHARSLWRDSAHSWEIAPVMSVYALWDSAAKPESQVFDLQPPAPPE